MVHIKVALAIGILSAGAANASIFGPKCKCTATDACWPNQQKWNQFSQTVGGRLVSPKPSAWVCYDPDAPAGACQEYRDKYFDSRYRASNPGMMQNWFYEESGDNGRCPLPPVGTTPADLNIADCKQGRVAAVGVDVREVGDIQKSIAFAKQHNLQLVIKSSGHDFYGRSTAPDAFQLWMKNFAGVASNASFVPQGAPSGTPGVLAVTVNAGTGWEDVYTHVENNHAGWSVVGGQSATVCAAGGFTLGGGHGALSPQYGLGADNVLEMTVVTVDGQVRKINKYRNPDLFWAMRGGGGGFAVIVDVTYKLNPAPANGYTAQVLMLTPKSGGFNATIMEEINRVFIEGTPALEANRWGGYFSLTPGMLWATFIGPSNYPTTVSTFKPIVDGFNLIANVNQQSWAIPQPSWQKWHQYVQGMAFPATGTDYTGSRSYIASRLIPAEALSDPSKLAKEFTDVTVANGITNGYVGHLVTGLGVRESDPTGSDTAVSPALRNAAYHMLWYNGWGAAANDTRIAQSATVLNSALDILRDAYPDSGAYYNEASFFEPKWQSSFWGVENYLKLLKIKAKYDPKGFFVCKSCVGSEIWGRDGKCKSILNLLDDTPFIKDALRELFFA
ncbi:hypothetical protein HDU85_002381 [Gaertneriomyces sp. JEL0708]|nr:hypothetical protein HDU85_002381 [Gaertneriomyces sp. JEL0708]